MAKINPAEWRPEHRIALAIGFVLGCVGGVILGYVIYGIGYGADAVSFRYWIAQPVHYGAIGWSAFGGIIGAAIIYTANLLRG